MEEIKKDTEQTLEQSEETVQAEENTDVEETNEETGEEDNDNKAAQEKEGADAKKGKPSPLEELNDKMMRTLAEFENYRKRSEKEKMQMFEVGAKSVIEKILPVIDNFERGLASVSPEEKESPFAEGIQMVYKQMLSAFDELGVSAITAVGEEFDPNLHNAVMMVDSEEFESGRVCEELQKGYCYKDSVVRHSMVKVAN